MNRHEGVYAVAIAVCTMLAFTIPFTLLRDVTAWFGSFLFWIVITIIVIGLNYALIKDWGKKS